MGVVKFTELDAIRHRAFEEAVKIYNDAFPSNERQSVNTVKDRVRQKLYRMFIGYLKNEPVFMALVWPFKNTEFMLLDYMAVKNGYQSKGIGTKFMQNIFDLLGVRDKYLILEVENPKHGDNKEQRERRVKFYKRIGAKELKNVRYLLPPLSGTTPTEMILMIIPNYKNGTISGKLVEKSILQIYRELYNRDSSDKYLNSFINEIPASVELN